MFGTRFISVSDSFDSNDYKGDTGGMQVAFKYLMHEYYSLDLSRKTKSSKYAKMKRGEYQSAVCCYGYKKGADGRMAIDEEAAAVVRLIFSLAPEMKNAADIVKVLYERKIPTPGQYRAAHGKGFHDVSRCHGIWQRSTVLRFLEDERYIGTYIMGKRTLNEIGGKTSRLKDESEWYKIPDHHPAIVDKALYELVQASMLHFKCDKHERQYALRGKVFCGSCGHAMPRTSNKNAVFVCRYTKVDESAVCNGLRIYESELETVLFEIIYKQARAILNVDSLESAGGMDLRFEQQAEYEKLIGKRRDEKRGLYERFVLREIDAEQYKALKATVDAELDRLNRAYAALSAQTAQAKAASEADGKLRGIAASVSKESGLTWELADLLIDKVRIYPGDHIEIDWKVADFAVAITINGGFANVG